MKSKRLLSWTGGNTLTASLLAVMLVLGTLVLGTLVSACEQATDEAGGENDAVYGIGLSAADTLVFGPLIEGYGGDAREEVTITNIGNRPTGKLTIDVSDEAAFTLSPATIDSIEAGGIASLDIMPKTELEAGIYTATVTVRGKTGSNIEPLIFDVSLTVNGADAADESVASPDEPVVTFIVEEPEEQKEPEEQAPVYGIELGRTEPLAFPDAIVGYGERTPQTITITNTGNRDTGRLTLIVSNGAFKLNRQTIDNIASEGAESFTAVPVRGLPVGTHTATVSVYGDTLAARTGARLGISITVKPVPAYGIELGGTNTLPDAIFGYGPQTPNTVTVTNIGNQPTGGLTIAVSDAVPSGWLTISTATIDSIEAGGSASLDIVPRTELAPGTYTATVTASGKADTGVPFSASFEASFKVNAPVTLDVSGTHTFPDAIFGYGPQIPKAVTVTNTGSSPTGGLTIAVSDEAAFTLSTATIDSIEAGGIASLQVVPRTELEAGTYTATVTASGKADTGTPFSASFEVSFKVNVAVTLDVSGTHTFPDAVFGEPLTPKTVIVTNIGGSPTGGLTIAVSDEAAFTLSPATIDSIEAGGIASLQVVPKTELAPGTYTATVTVSGKAGTASFGVRFKVIAATDSISLGRTDALSYLDALLAGYIPAYSDIWARYHQPMGPTETLVWGAVPGYEARSPQSITIINTGNRPTGDLTIGVSNPSAWTLTPASTAASLAAGESGGTFTVAPKTGLPVGTHTATVTVSGANGGTVSFGVSFKVNTPPQTFAALLSRMAQDKNCDFYTLPGGAESYTQVLTLSGENCPGNLVIDGGGRVITGNGNGITLHRSLTLRNITFINIPFTVEANCTLVLDNGAVIRGNAGAGVTVSGSRTYGIGSTNEGNLEMKAGSLVTGNNASGIQVSGAYATFTMNGGTISGNSGGGGVSLYGFGSTCTMNGGTISGNNGNGVTLFDYALCFAMNGGTISYNDGNGVQSGTFSLFSKSGGQIYGNTGWDISTIYD